MQESTEARPCLNHQMLQFYNAKLNVVLLAYGTSELYSRYVLEAHTKAIFTYLLTYSMDKNPS